MNINSIAIVRATNVIPFDGVVKPISESQYIKKNCNSLLAQKIKDLIRKNNLIPPINHSNFTEEYMKERTNLLNNITMDLIPYTSDYNSLVLFSLNGLVPDDSEMSFGNNVFSDKKCVVIDALSEHINETISLMPTDTAISGNVFLSNKAIVLIDENTYLNLTINEKQSLSKLNLKVKTFSGDLKKIVYNELLASGCYVPEYLSLSRKDGGFINSPTSKKVKETINTIAKEYKIPQVLFFNLITGQNDYLDKLDNFKSELDNSYLVQDYYMFQFYQYIFALTDAPQDLTSLIPDYMNHDFFLDKFIKYIEDIGIDKYKNLVSIYNSELEEDRAANRLLTPNQIIENIKLRKNK